MRIYCVRVAFIHTLVLVCAFIVAPGDIAFTQEKSSEPFNWEKINGTWEIKKTTAGKSYLFQTRIKCVPTGYSELIDYNSIITTKPVPERTRVSFRLYITNPGPVPIELMLVFAAKDFRNLHAVKLVGDRKGVSTVSLVSSRVNSPELPKSVKKNYTITELKAVTHKLRYNDEVQVAIDTSGRKATLFLNGERILTHETDTDLQNGMIGFGCRNVQMAVGDVAVSNGSRIVFEDSFTTESIKRHSVIATPVEKK